ncbi:hypothetical protein [Pseudomonas sp. Q1-7]|uniref:hypothetical protein n=1 Tax=Pseudomonas sp. Q1-7 TaxID=3020843 RepID=UPI0023012852|nr:hypothetical protein [Pseudomonas sp. Q1-7]
MLSVIALLPWKDPRLVTDGSYVTVLDTQGAPHARTVINFVVLTSVTSSGTPIYALLLSTGAVFRTEIVNHLALSEVFGFLMAGSGAIAMRVCPVIAIPTGHVSAWLAQLSVLPKGALWVGMPCCCA